MNRATSSASASRSGAGDAAFALAPEARRRISMRLDAGMAGVGLFALGTILGALRPDEWQVAELVRAIAALVVGIPILASGVRGLVTGDPSRTTDQLVAIAVLAAAATGQFGIATLIPLVLELGRLFEERSALGARAAIAGIQALAAPRAVRVIDGRDEETVSPEALSPGDVIVVRPGERIAVDGVVLEGRAAIDPSAVTGESVHQDVAPASLVFAGTVCLDGMLRIAVRSVGGGTVLGRVVALLAEVERAATPILRLFERRAAVWLPLVLTIAATTLFFTRDLSRAIAILVVASPTALVVAGPAAVIAGMSVATRLRTLVKSAELFERASDVDTLVLDKTGTVTIGMPTVAELEPVPGVADAELLATAAGAGEGSRHPLSRAVVAEARDRGLAIAAPADVQERPGLGVTAILGDAPAILGRRELLAELGVAVPDAAEAVGSEVWVAAAGRCLGRIVLRDRPKPEARAAIDHMRALGIERVILLTGDRAAVAQDVGEALGVDAVIAEVLPAQKLELVCAEQAAGRVVMMVGDGVNDAPALAAADVGIAIGAELNEIALGGADVAILGTDLGRVPQLVMLADATRAALAQNVWIAFGLAALSIALAAAGVLHPLAGAVAQSLAVLAVVVNSARILRAVSP